MGFWFTKERIPLWLLLSAEMLSWQQYDYDTELELSNKASIGIVHERLPFKMW